MIDLHMHSSVSDGTDTPVEILSKVREAGLSVFSLTDHDAVKGCGAIRACLTDGDPVFLTGVEFSCKDERGSYHVLGYGYDPKASSIAGLIEKGHSFRIRKCALRLEFLKERFGIVFPEDEIKKLFRQENPGKPHIGNLMVKCGYASSKEEAITQYINHAHFKSEYLRPEEAVKGILDGGGIPVLAHPSYGNGGQLIIGAEMEERLRRLIGYGLKGVEAFYSGFSPKLIEEMLSYARKYGLYVTAGSDYHGANKLIAIGETNLPERGEYPDGLLRFLEDAAGLKSK